MRLDGSDGRSMALDGSAGEGPTIRLGDDGDDGDTPFPVAPMVDVIFILLLFFVSVSSIRDARVEIDLPEVGRATEDVLGEQTTALVVEVDAESAVYVDGEEVAEGEALRSRIERAAADHPSGSPVRVKGDAEASYRVIMTVLSELAASGLGNVEFVVQRRAEGGP